MQGEYQAKTVGIAAVEGVEVDIEVRGDEDRAEKVMMDLKDRIGWIAAAYEAETPPNELDDRPDELTPLMTVAWDRLFEDEDD